MIASLKDYYRYLSYFTVRENTLCPAACVWMATAMFTSRFRLLTISRTARSLSMNSLTPAWQTVRFLHGLMKRLRCPWKRRVRSKTFVLDREIYERHVAYWNVDTIQTFWSGESWQIPGESFELSYNLAQVLWRKIELDIGASREAIMKFIATAKSSDGGEAACRSIFKMSLADLITSFLGKGKWNRLQTERPTRPLRRRDCLCWRALPYLVSLFPLNQEALNNRL